MMTSLVVNTIPHSAPLTPYPAANNTRDADHTNTPADDLEITPAFSSGGVAICFSSDANYIPYLAVAIRSIIAHASSKWCYDITILHSSVPISIQEVILSMQTKNLRIRFLDVTPLLHNYNCSLPTALHFTEETYYRFFIPEMFRKYEKVIYLDCDLIINRDIAELYKTSMDATDWLAAASDPFVRYRVLQGDKYFTERLGLEHPDSYFQAGVLIFNIRPLLDIDFAREAFKILRRMGTPRFVDQDVLNYLCQRHVRVLDMRWNLECHLSSGVCKNWRDILPHDLLAEYDRAYHDPWIIHFCGRAEKPWFIPELPLSDYFWRMARDTPYYESIIYHSFRKMVQDIYELPKLRKKLTRLRLSFFFSFGVRRRRLKAEKRHLKDKIHSIRLAYPFTQPGILDGHQTLL